MKPEDPSPGSKVHRIQCTVFEVARELLRAKMSSSHLARGGQQVTFSLQALLFHSVSKEAMPDNLTTFSGPENLCWNRKWQPTPVFLPGKFHGQRSLAGAWGCKELDTTERSMPRRMSAS